VRDPEVNRLRAVLAGTAIAVLCAVLVACSSDSSGDDSAGAAGGGMAGNAAPAAKFSEIYAMMFPMATNARCDACHSMPANDIANGNLEMGTTQMSAYMALVGQTSKSSRCMSKTLVVPGQPEMSLLYQKLSSATPPCGSRMPLGGTAFSDAQLEMIRSWIAAGAKND
jgi:hypothetical protein